MFFIVGLTDPPTRLAVCASADAASAYIETLPDYEDGRYYIDAMMDENGPLILKDPADLHLLLKFR